MKKAACFVVCLCVVGLMAGRSWGSISLSVFPDLGLRGIMSGYDSGWIVYDSDGYAHRIGDNDGILSDIELTQVKSLYLGSNVKSIKGTELLTTLTYLAWDCSGSDLTAIDASNNPKLTRIVGYNNDSLKSLNVSGCTALETLRFNGCHLEKLNVSGCTALKTLDCFNNSITELDLSGCNALEYLQCAANQMTQLDLSQNKALSFSDTNGNLWQKVRGLKLKRNSEGHYEVNMKDYVPNLENITYIDNPQLLSYNKGTGIAVFNGSIESLKYGYNTHLTRSDGDIFMPVRLTNAISVNAIEREGSNIYGIIHDITENGYLHYSDQLTESYISDLSYSDYGKIGLTADGNSRLILRVKTDKPGTVSFSFNKDIGAKIESLSRGELSPSDQLSTTQFSDWLFETHQVSAVLVAPERFPEDKNFPSDTFKVHVKLTDEDGEITEDDLELKIEAAPVMLIHGLNAKGKDTFGIGENSGIWHCLTKAGFDVYHWDYDGTKGPEDILAGLGDENGLYTALKNVFTNYAERGIVCTRADFVCHSMGGLMARKYLNEAAKDVGDGNNWSVLSYKQGMVRRVVTVATPHRGSPFAEFALAHPKLAGKVFGKDCTSAFIDLRVSAPRDYGFPADVPMYSIYGDISEGLTAQLALLGAVGAGKFVVQKLPKFPVLMLPAIAAGAAAGTSIAVFVNEGMFHGEGHDIVVSISSAISDFIGYETGYKGWDYMHTNNCHQDITGNKVVSLLKGSVNMFKTFGAGTKSAIPSQKGTITNSNVDEELQLIEDMRLNVQPAVFMVSDVETKTAKFTLNAGSPVSDVYCAIGDGKDYRLFMIPDTDGKGKNFSAEVTFTAQDRGTFNVFCFSRNPNNSESLYVSNTVNMFSLEDTNSSSPKITTAANLPTVSRRKSYSVALKADGAVTSWSIVNGELPVGLSLNASTGKITGTPTVAGTYKFTLLAENDGGYDAREFTLQVTQTTLTGDIPASTTRRATYTGTPKVTGGASPYVWTISAGKLPDGLKINASTGKITGNPTKAGTFKFTVKAKDKNGAASTKDYTVKVTQTTLTGDIPASTTRRATYTGTPKVTGGASPYVWTISAGKLPDGLKINASTGKITGNPSKAGTFKFTVKAKDKNGAASSKAYTVKVTQTTLTGNIPASTTRRASYAGLPKVSGGASPYVWTISAGKLPDGLKINASTGKITGNPSKAGTFKFTVKAKDKNGAASTKAYTVKVTQTKVTGTFSNTTKGSSFTATPKASGGTSPYAWSVSSGKLPNGLKINASTGKITGTTTKAGTFTFTIKAKDKNGAAGTKSFTVKVSATVAKNSTTETKPDSTPTTQTHNNTYSLPAMNPQPLTESAGVTSSIPAPYLYVASSDILESFDGADSDIVRVNAGLPLRFFTGGWEVDASNLAVHVNDEHIDGVTVSEEGQFTLPAGIASGDFRVRVKSSNGETESQELYIISE